MSLIISNKASAKQLEMLEQMGYYGKQNLTVEQAAQLIKEYWEEERLERKRQEEALREEYGDLLDIY